MTGNDWEFRIRACEASFATAQRNTATPSVYLEIQRPPVLTYLSTLASIFTLYQPRMIHYIFPLIYILMYLFVIFSINNKHLNNFNSCLFNPFISVFVSCTGWHFCEAGMFYGSMNILYNEP